MPLPIRTLGATGLEITTVGFGAWAIGGGGWAFGWGPQDDGDSLAAMRHALALGINWIDTAAVYGLGHSEEVVGRLLRELPPGGRPLVFTKCGLVWDERDRMAEARRVLRPASIRKEVEASLSRLGVERIDLYQFHWPDETGTPVEDSWGEMVRLVEQGEVGAAGVSNFGVELLRRIENVRHVASLQPPFSLIRRAAAAAEIPWCAEHGTGVIVYSPMQSGLLTDGFTAERATQLAADDWRRRSPEFGQPNLGRNLALRNALRPIAERRGTTAAAPDPRGRARRARPRRRRRGDGGARRTGVPVRSRRDADGQRLPARAGVARGARAGRHRAVGMAHPPAYRDERGPLPRRPGPGARPPADAGRRGEPPAGARCRLQAPGVAGPAPPRRAEAARVSLASAGALGHRDERADGERAADAGDAPARPRRARDHPGPGPAREARSRPVPRGGRAARRAGGRIGRRGRQRVGPPCGPPRASAGRRAPLGRVRRR